MEEALFPSPELVEFQPDIVYIHTSWANVDRYPSIENSEDQVQNLLEQECERYAKVWQSLKDRFQCGIIQNNFDYPPFRALGNLDGVVPCGRSHFLRQLNQRFAEYAMRESELYINDINYLSSLVGLNQWYESNLWHTSKLAQSLEALPVLAHNVTKIILSVLGRSKKCLVLDLDNTLWGGVVGEDGVDNLEIGQGTPVGEAYLQFQAYVRMLNERGVILAVCSKNDNVAAQDGLRHPESLLSNDVFAAFCSNWSPKHVNIEKIAEDLNLALDSFVFVDDNPAERELVRSQLPSVTVPDVGADVTDFLDTLDKEGYFEPATLSGEDLDRSQYYKQNQARETVKAQFSNYKEYLLSLEMKAEIAPFTPVHLERITQLVNKTNQFNLTTFRFTRSEIESFMVSEDHITLYGKMSDRFGDNGLISVIVAEVKVETVDILLWLMSCRVVGRDMELALFDELTAIARKRGAKRLTGTYIESAKNRMVARHYESLGFAQVRSSADDRSTWSLALNEDLLKLNTSIFINAD